jgi:hypothetical protein
VLRLHVRHLRSNRAAVRRKAKELGIPSQLLHERRREQAAKEKAALARLETGGPDRSGAPIHLASD